MRVYEKRPVEERFWERVEVRGEDECWPWLRLDGSPTEGRGQLWIDGANEYAPRVSWALAYGPIPDDRFVLHDCDNPSCVNPAHLFLGTQRENMLDMEAKGRRARCGRSGSKNPAARLTLSRVRAMRALAGEMSYGQLARRFGVSKSQVVRIVNYENWRVA